MFTLGMYFVLSALAHSATAFLKLVYGKGVNVVFEDLLIETFSLVDLLQENRRRVCTGGTSLFDAPRIRYFGCEAHNSSLLFCS